MFVVFSALGTQQRSFVKLRLNRGSDDDYQ